jgi:hypothetical protein
MSAVPPTPALSVDRNERGGGRGRRGDHRNPRGDQLGRERRQAVEPIVRPAVFNGDVPALDEAGSTDP